MKRLFKDTIFFRLFALVLAAIVIGHLTTFALLAGFGLNPEAREFRPPLEAHEMPRPPHGAFKLGMPPPPEAFHERRSFPPPGLWIGLITQFIALTIAAWFGARLLARPIQRLGNAAAQLGTTLNGPMIEEEGPIEARRAAQVFNQMQARIRLQMEERGRFLAAVSHDLRTPLTRMKLRLERPDESIQRERLLNDIEEMAAMLGATLDYFRSEATIEMPQLLDVQALLESMVEDLVENGRDVTLTGASAAITTLPLALRRCLSNLLENALRYGESASISIADSHDMLAIDIRDRGPGIPPDKLQAVFEPFVRLEGSRNKATGGVGLGLAIAKDAARQCGGKLILKNAEDGGLIASVLIPRK